MLIAAIQTLRRQALSSVRCRDVHRTEHRYGDDDRHQLTLWTPLTAPPSDGWPTVMLLHGGGWIEGSRTDFLAFAPRLARIGLQCAAMDYRLAPQHPWPAQQEDTLQALAYLREHGNMDPSRCALWGHSAGGHIALLVSTQIDVTAVVALGAPGDLLAVPHTSDAVFSADWRQKASPLQALPLDGPPILLVHGTRDRICAIRSTRQLQQRLSHRCTLLEIAGGNHGLHWPFVGCVDARRAAVRWLNSALQPTAHPPD